MRYTADEIAHPDWPLRQLDKMGGLRWVKARPEPDGRFLTRLRSAWAVLTGRADALFWEDQ